MFKKQINQIGPFLTQRFQCRNALIENLLSTGSLKSKICQSRLYFHGLLPSGTGTTQQQGTWCWGILAWWKDDIRQHGHYVGKGNGGISALLLPQL